MNVTISRDLGQRIVAVLLAVILVIAYKGWQEGWPPFGPTDDKWTGVFLTNGQAYFGHWYAGPGDAGILRDVYYVLATQLQSQDPNQPNQTQLSLQRLGGEIHGPQSEMRIEKRQVLFTEDLRADSPLVTSIKQLKSGGAAPGTQAPATQPAATQPAATQAPAASTPARTASPSPTR
jgi:hypothetical protein